VIGRKEVTLGQFIGLANFKDSYGEFMQVRYSTIQNSGFLTEHILVPTNPQQFGNILYYLEQKT
jgi:hypothetical protein